MPGRDAECVDDFAERYAAISGRKDYERFVGLFGVRRTRSDFWDTADWFQNYGLVVTKGPEFESGRRARGKATSRHDERGQRRIA